MGDVQEMNRALVLRILREHQLASRVEISKYSGLRQTTVTNIVGDLIECGIVRETTLIKGPRGRRAIGVQLNHTMYRIVCLRLTRHHIRAGLYDMTGAQYAFTTERTEPEQGVQAALAAIKRVIRALIAESGEARIPCIAMGLPGPYLRKDGRIAVMADFPGWDTVSIRDELSRDFSIPVYLEYDAYAGALAEWWFGGQRGEGVSTLLSLQMEQGLGAGLVTDGAVLYGSQGVAGNIGHLSIDYRGIACECGNRGCLRNYCTAAALLRDVGAALSDQSIETKLRGLHPPRLEDVVAAARAGDAFAREMLARSARFLAYGLVSAVYAYNPDMIVLSEEFSGAGEMYLDEIRAVLRERLLPALYENIRVCFSTLKNDTVIMGAVALATNMILQNPTAHLIDPNSAG